MDNDKQITTAVVTRMKVASNLVELKRSFRLFVSEVAKTPAIGNWSGLLADVGRIETVRRGQYPQGCDR